MFSHATFTRLAAPSLRARAENDASPAALQPRAALCCTGDALLTTSGILCACRRSSLFCATMHNRTDWPSMGRIARCYIGINASPSRLFASSSPPRAYNAILITKLTAILPLRRLHLPVLASPLLRLFYLCRATLRATRARLQHQYCDSLSTYRIICLSPAYRRVYAAACSLPLSRCARATACRSSHRISVC